MSNVGAVTDDFASSVAGAFRSALSPAARALLAVILTLAALGGPAAAQGLFGEYFDDADLTQLVDTRIDPTIDFTNWSTAPTGTAVTPDSVYSERWQGSVRVDATGLWTFRTISNDGVRVWVDDELLIDNWTNHTATTDAGQVSLTSGWHSIRVEHYQSGGNAIMQLYFQGPGQTNTIIPSDHLSYDGPPVVTTGHDAIAYIPTDVYLLTGTATDDSGLITDFAWSQVAGPPAVLVDVGNGVAGAFNLFTPGYYTFRLAATDPTGLVGTDDLTIYVLGVGNGNGVISGNSQLYQPLTFWFTDDEQLSENDNDNPFRNRRLDLEIEHDDTGTIYNIPGYFAADGLAADSGATSGEFWRAHFTPPLTGVWRWKASFRKGTDVAIANNPLAGQPTGFDGAYGAFQVLDADPTAAGFLATGGPRNVEDHYLVTPGDDRAFFKIGANSPENLLAFADFDQTPPSHAYAPHVSDWKPGDPTWKNGKGKGLIGGLNYLSSFGVNTSYFLTFNVAGDGDDVWPWTAKNERFRFDVSKLDQWDRAFSHMDSLGMMLHVLLQETENDDGNPGLDNGNLGVERKLYLRELIARFAHHSALTWNLGEENSNSTDDLGEHHDYIESLDAYNHPIVLHTFPSQKNNKYEPMLENGWLDGASLQVGTPITTHEEVLEWRNKSQLAGARWIVSMDEQGSAQNGVKPDANANGHDTTRRFVLWPTMMAGGAGCEWYFGYGYPNDDLDCEDWSSREEMWQLSSYATDFFATLDDPRAMEPADALVAVTSAHCLADPGEQYAIYLQQGGSTQVNLGTSTSRFSVSWFDPRNGGSEQNGSKLEIQGPGWVGIGQAPSNSSDDWVVRLDRLD